MDKKIKVKEKVNGLELPLCQKDAAVAVGGYQDNFINGVTYRVWSVFEGQTSAAKSLSNLMLRRLETGDEIGVVTDEFEEMIQRKNASAR